MGETGPTSPAPRRGIDRDLIDTERLNVFVPAILGVGLVFWLVGELRDLAHSSIDAARDKQARIAGHAIARSVVGTDTSDGPEQRGLRSRPAYVVLAVALIGAALYLGLGSVANYRYRGGAFGRSASLLALGLSAAAVALALGALAGVVVATWPSPPARARPLLRRSMLTTQPIEGAPTLRHPPRRLGAAVMACAGIAALLTVVVGGAPHLIDAFDRRVGIWFERFELGWWTTVTENVFGTEGVIALALVVSVAALRCRVLTVAYLSAVGLAMTLGVLTSSVVERKRPPWGPRVGFDSFPSGHVAQSMVITILLPLAVATLLHRRRGSVPLQIGLAALAIGSAVDRLSAGIHWPTDVLAGAALGLALGLAGRWAIEDQRAHVRCRSCPWALGVEERRRHVHAHHLPADHAAHPDRHAHPLNPRGIIELTPSAASLTRFAARITAALAAIGLAVAALVVGLPESGEGYVFAAQIERPVQLALAAMVSLGALAGRRRPAVGAVAIAFAASLLGVFAAIQYPPLLATALTAMLMVPAFLLWLSWQHRRAPHELAAVAALTTLLVGATWGGAWSVYDTYFGPTHPPSDTASVPVDEVEWVLTGVPTPGSVTVTARLREEDATARVEVRPDGSDDRVRSAIVDVDEFGIARMTVEGLEPDTSYAYRVVVDGEPDAGRGHGEFRTTVAGPLSFKVVLGSCARVGSNGSVFDAMAAEDPLLYLALGDIHYGNIEATAPGPFLDAWDRLLTEPAQAALYRSVPFAYIWDDHDYGGNDADSSSPGRAAVAEVYRSVVPNGDLVDDIAIYQAFTVGRVRFVLTDTRSQRTADTMLGDEQLAWLLDELETSSRTHAAVVWANAVPWVSEAVPGGDDWSGYPQERERIADAIADAGIDNLVMVSGDAHMVALDDGTNTGFASDGETPGFPLLHAAALDRPGNVKGGPYSDGAFPGSGQYGVLEVVDPGGDGPVEVILSGRTWDGRTLVSRTFELPRQP